MANAKKCDRCGALYETPKTNFIEVKGRSFIMSEIKEDPNLNGYTNNIDLCQKCKESFVHWLLEDKEVV